MQSTWILVADSVRARLFSPNADSGSLTELEDFVNPNGRKPGRAFSHDRPPRTMESEGSLRHVIEPHTTPEHKIAEHFARELSDVLERGRVDHRFERLILAAPPHFLGALQHALGKQVRDCVVGHLDKDLTTLPVSEIQSRLTEVASGTTSSRPS